MIPAREKNANKKDKKKKIFKFCCCFLSRDFHFHSGRVGAQESNVDTVSNVSSTGSHQVPKRNRRKNEAKKREGMIETDRYIKERRGNKTKKSNGKKKRQKKVDERHTHQSYLALPWRISVFLFRFFFLLLGEEITTPTCVDV